VGSRSPQVSVPNHHRSLPTPLFHHALPRGLHGFYLAYRATEGRVSFVIFVRKRLSGRCLPCRNRTPCLPLVAWTGGLTTVVGTHFVSAATARGPVEASSSVGQYDRTNPCLPPLGYSSHPRECSIPAFLHRECRASTAYPPMRISRHPTQGLPVPFSDASIPYIGGMLPFTVRCPYLLRPLGTFVPGGRVRAALPRFLDLRAVPARGPQHPGHPSHSASRSAVPRVPAQCQDAEFTGPPLEDVTFRAVAYQLG
jgi:hypothetical protein